MDPKKRFVYLFDDFSRMEEAVNSLEKEHWNDVIELTYMQVPVVEKIHRQPTPGEIIQMMQEQHMGVKPRSSKKNEQLKQIAHVIAFEVKNTKKLDNFGKLLCACGGYEAGKKLGWYKKKTKKICHVILGKRDIGSILKRYKTPINASRIISKFGA